MNNTVTQSCTTLLSCIALLWASENASHGQGTFIYDQQSSTELNFGEGLGDISSNQPIGQSFTPSLDSVGFIRVYLSDNAFNGLGATVYLILRSDSITGSSIASTLPVTVPDRFHGPVDMLFAVPVVVSPGTTYFWQPVIQSGDSFSTSGDRNFNYSGGMAFFKGVGDPTQDLWFREGVIVPEPSAISLSTLGGGLVFAVLRRKHASRSGAAQCHECQR